MDRKTFREYMLKLISFGGQPYLEDTIEINKFINERVRKFAQETLCLYSDNISFAVSGGVAVYDLRDTTYFGKEIVRAQSIVVSSYGPLINYQGSLGPTSVDELSTQEPNYLSTTAARPKKWLILPIHSIRLWPEPDQAYTAYVRGWYLPAEITTAASGDTTEIELPEEFQRTAAMFAAAHLMLPTSTGQPDYEKLQLLSKAADDEMKNIRSIALKALDGPSVRGLKKNINNYWI